MRRKRRRRRRRKEEEDEGEEEKEEEEEDAAYSCLGFSLVCESSSSQYRDRLFVSWRPLTLSLPAASLWWRRCAARRDEEMPFLALEISIKTPNRVSRRFGCKNRE